MSPPFSAGEFFAVFASYNRAVWPAQILLAGTAAAGALISVLRPTSTRLLLWYLAALWAWMGVAYHWAFFSELTPAAWVFGSLFVLQAGLFLAASLRYPDRRLTVERNASGLFGGFLLVYALVLYPALGWVLGHHYPTQPTFGLPCPTTIYTFGMLLWIGDRVPRRLLAIPILWSLVGTSAAWLFGVAEDLLLPLAGIGGSTLILMRNRRLPALEGAAVVNSAI